MSKNRSKSPARPHKIPAQPKPTSRQVFTSNGMQTVVVNTDFTKPKMPPISKGGKCKGSRSRGMSNRRRRRSRHNRTHRRH